MTNLIEIGIAIELMLRRSHACNKSLSAFIMLENVSRYSSLS